MNPVSQLYIAQLPCVGNVNGGGPLILSAPQKPTREFTGGQYVDITMNRESLAEGFGFSVKREWLGVGNGHAVVVAEIVAESVASGSLHVNDIIVLVNGTLVESWGAEHVKEVLRYTDVHRVPQ